MKYEKLKEAIANRLDHIQQNVQISLENLKADMDGMTEDEEEEIHASDEIDRIKKIREDHENLMKKYSDFVYCLNKQLAHRIDWRDDSQDKYYLFYSHSFKAVFQGRGGTAFQSQGVIYCLDSQLLEKATRIFTRKEIRQIVTGVTR